MPCCRPPEILVPRNHDGGSNKFTAEEQLDQISLYWINLNDGDPRGLTVHITSADRDVSFDLNGGNRIPRAAERLRVRRRTAGGGHWSEQGAARARRIVGKS